LVRAAPHPFFLFITELVARVDRCCGQMGAPMPRYKDVLDGIETTLARIAKYEAEKDHRDLDMEETHKVRPGMLV